MPDLVLKQVRILGKPTDTCWDVCCQKGLIGSIEESRSKDFNVEAPDRLVMPSLAHPHIHLDKCFLLSHPKYSDLQVERGDFAEALRLTSEAKSRFEHVDLMDRGRALIEESINFGVTHMRVFVEVDLGVELKCLKAGLELKREFHGQRKCYLQVCVFAQNAIFSYEDGGAAMMALLQDAVHYEGVEVLGSTPYVEAPENIHRNIDWTSWLARENNLHLDFHIDYNLDPEVKPFIPRVMERMEELKWPQKRVPSPADRTVVLGHCTRLTLYTAEEWRQLSRRAADRPIYFVGLPTSDLFMMGRPQGGSGGGERVRGTLQIPQMIKEYGLDAAIGINNVGNAFTPHGNCDPLRLASFATGIYQAGTKEDGEIMLESVSSRAKLAIGLGDSPHNEFTVGSPANFIVVNGDSGCRSKAFRYRKTAQEVVCDPPSNRKTIFEGKVVGGTEHVAHTLNGGTRERESHGHPTWAPQPCELDRSIN